METDKLSASEAVFGFAGWLTSRKEKTVMSSSDEAGCIAELVDAFCKVNKLTPPREEWATNLIHPNGECSQVND